MTKYFCSETNEIVGDINGSLLPMIRYITVGFTIKNYG